jgi:hypothetical protein
MRYTEEEQRAYDRALDLSRAEHGRPSTRRALEALADECRKGLPAGSTVMPYMPVPAELIEEYGTEDEQAAFFAGWLDGAGALTPELVAQLCSSPH